MKDFDTIKYELLKLILNFRDWKYDVDMYSFRRSTKSPFEWKWRI